MKLYACYTASHHAMLTSHFLPTAEREFGKAVFYDGHRVPWYLFPGARLFVRKMLQYTPSGAFDSAGFQRTCIKKVEFILGALAAETEPFIFSDVDVRFYGPVVDDLAKCLGDLDMVFQWDGPRGIECSGFMVLRPSPKLLRFWQGVRDLMAERGYMDQPALHHRLASDTVKRESDGGNITWRTLPVRYWTFGHSDKHWTPGTPVNPPTGMLVHHANWTVGVDNKMKLLDAVCNHVAGIRPSDPAIYLGGKRIEPCAADLLTVVSPKESYFPLVVEGKGVIQDAKIVLDVVVKQPPARHIPTTEEIQNWRDEEALLRQTAKHHALPLALVLQFWEKDKDAALRLAELLADIEPEPRDDVLFVFAAQQGTQLEAADEKRMIRVGRKFRYTKLVAKIDPRKVYPGVCFDPWASAFAQICNAYYEGNRMCGSAFFFEADGAPMTKDWIDRLKAAHAETRLHGKRATGPRMREHDHINGTMILDASLWRDRPSLHQCPAEEPWDIWHGPIFIVESHPSNIIRNEYGLSYTRDSFAQLGRESAWCTSCKDGTAHHWARQLLTPRK